MNIRDKIAAASSHPGYDAVAAGYAKSACFLFVGTFVLHLMFSDAKPGLLGGLLFFVAGLFVAPLMIAMPTLIASILFPKAHLALRGAGALAIIVITRWSFLSLF